MCSRPLETCQAGGSEGGGQKESGGAGGPSRVPPQPPLPPARFFFFFFSALSLKSVNYSPVGGAAVGHWSARVRVQGGGCARKEAPRVDARPEERERLFGAGAERTRCERHKQTRTRPRLPVREAWGGVAGDEAVCGRACAYVWSLCGVTRAMSCGTSRGVSEEQTEKNARSHASLRETHTVVPSRHTLRSPPFPHP